MVALIQRVKEASVTVEGNVVGAIGPGLLILLGVHVSDTEEEMRWLADKTLGLRIFADAEKPMNRSVRDIDGELLVVSQFTLAADTSKGKRPGFSNAAPPPLAERLYEAYVAKVSAQCGVQTGRFGADMQVSLTNDGPATFMLER